MIRETKEQYIESKYELLRDFKTAVTPDIVDKVESLYPNRVAIDNYIRDVIMARLEKFC